MNARTTILGTAIAAAVVVLIALYFLLPGADDPPPSAAVQPGAQAAQRPSAPNVRSNERFGHEPNGVPVGSVLMGRPAADEDPQVVDMEALNPPAEIDEIPIDIGPPESDRAAVRAIAIQDTVLRMVDALYGAERSNEIGVECSTDGESCRFDGPAFGPDFTVRWLKAVESGDIAPTALGALDFEGFRDYTQNGEKRFTVVAHLR